VSRARSELERLLQTRERARQLIEQQTLLTTAAIDSSQPNIQLRRRAAASARKNLDIIRDKYARGAASIIELLDAQNQTFAQDQAAAVAGYEFLQDLIDFQRSLSWFEKFGSEESRAAWVRRLKAYLAERGLDHGLHPQETP
jgi:outer membrane protein TolC